MTTESRSRSPEQQEAFRLAVGSFLQDIAVALPGKIDDYDATTQKATVKPLVKRLLAAEDGKEVVESIPPIKGVPVVFPRGGGFFISMPVKKGDFCLLVFNSFPIDKYKAGDGSDTHPQDFSMHDLSDAVALMGFAPFAKAIKDADADNMVLGKEEGTQIHLADSKIELGQKGATEKVPVDSKLQNELTSIGQQITSIGADLTLLSAHVHLGNMGIPTGIPTPPPTGGQSYSKSPTNSTLVTIKE